MLRLAMQASGRKLLSLCTVETWSILEARLNCSWRVFVVTWSLRDSILALFREVRRMDWHCFPGIQLGSIAYVVGLRFCNLWGQFILVLNIERNSTGLYRDTSFASSISSYMVRGYMKPQKYMKDFWACMLSDCLGSAIGESTEYYLSTPTY